MDVTRFSEAPFYTLPGHEEVVARRLQGAEASPADFAVVGHSAFPAGAVVPIDAGSTGKIYVVIGGELTVIEADGAMHRLLPGDSIHIAAGEARAIRNEGAGKAAMIVITPPAPGTTSR